VLVIIDVVNIFFKHHDQDITLFNATISFLESNICMSFKSIVSFTFIIFTKFTLALLNQISCNNREKSQLNSMKSFVQHQAIIINIMILSTQLFSDFASVSLKNLLKTYCHAALNENIRSIHVDVEREERQCTLLQTRMKVVEHEFSFITLNEIQSVINNMKILQRQQNYLKMYAQRKMLFIKNVTLLEDLNQAFYMLNSDYFLT